MKVKLRITGDSGWTSDSDTVFELESEYDGVCIHEVGTTLQEEFGLRLCIGDKIELVEVRQ